MSKNRKKTQCRHYKTSIFPFFLLKTPDGDRIVCGYEDGSGWVAGKTGRSRYFRSWVSLRGHGAVASSAVEVLSLGRDGGPAIVLHGLGCCLRLLGFSP